MTALVGCAVCLAGCAGITDPPAAREMINATLWQQRSAEYRALSRQTYRLAQERLTQALGDPAWTAALEQTPPYARLPPAVILDVDETVLDNTPYESRIILDYGRFSPETFAAWCQQAAATAVPGVKAFLDRARALGVTIFYYTSRREALRECTARNLRRQALPLAEDGSTLLLNDGTSKSELRRRIAHSYRILLLVGDSLEDFTDGSTGPPERRLAIARAQDARWGKSWIVLPNPMYGHWEATYYDFDYSAPRAEQMRRKASALEPAAPE